jgi:hypothetical protein
MILDYAIDATVASPFCRLADISSQATLTVSFPVWVKDTAAAVNEGSDMSLDDLETTDVTITVGMFGVLREITDLVATSTILGSGLTQAVVQEAAMLCMEKFEDLIVATYANASSSVGTSGANLTFAQFVSAYHVLNQALAQGPKVSVLHPIQAADLVDDLVGLSTSWLTHNGVDASLLSGQSGQGGYMGTLLNVPIYQTSLCDTANAGADRVGAMFVNGSAENGGNPRMAATGVAVKWLPKVRTQSDAAGSADVLGITMCAAASELKDASICKIVTDA